MDGNEAVASVAHRVSEVIAIYPITPASSMGELADEWTAAGRRNVWGTLPEVVQMQSEGGAAGALHGALQAGSLATTFTSSQGLLLMIPDLYKIAGELTSFCMHVAARAIATHALSIFGDHSDVMAVRQTGVALLASGSVQEAHDFACIGHAATLLARVPFLHFFDGFRTSHEIAKIEVLADADLIAMMSAGGIEAHRARALTPDQPVIRGTAQNPDTFFQAREACNPFYEMCPAVVQARMDQFAARTGRAYHLFDYVGHPEAERVIVLMGSGAETAHATADWLIEQGEKVGVLKVRLFRPFSITAFTAALPKTVRAIAVLDRTKEPGALGEPLYQDVVTALREAEDQDLPRPAEMPRVVGGRYGLSSKEFSPSMVKVVFDELKKNKPKNHFTVGINDDVTKTSLPVGEDLEIDPEGTFKAVFYGLGSDGTVGSNKNSIKIIGERTKSFVQAYFVYDSKKSGTVTISHLRFGPKPIQISATLKQADFIACHVPELLERLDVLELAAPGAKVLLNMPGDPKGAWDRLPRELQAEIIEKRLKLYAIDGFAVARDAGLGRHISAVMQTCFFAVSGVLPLDEAVREIKSSIEKTFGKKGGDVVQKNVGVVDKALEALREVPVPDHVTTTRARPPIVPDNAPDFVKRVTALMMANKGDLLPVSAFPVDGTWPTGTSQWEKRAMALDLPTWDPSLCIQCNKCALICPHAAIRAKVYPPERLAGAPDGFLSMDYKAGELAGQKYTIQLSPDDCTGCSLCVQICPAKDKKNPSHKSLDMRPAAEIRERERPHYEFFHDLPDADRKHVHLDVKGSQLLEPLFEFSGACTGCGETPYIKLLTQLFGDRLLIANATGCSSIFGGNLPTTPYTTNKDGRGPAWANSLFEDNAEFGLGFRVSIDTRAHRAAELLHELTKEVGEELALAILHADQRTEEGVFAQRERIAKLKSILAKIPSEEARRLEDFCDDMVRKSVWLVGGDGWAYDIDYGGLDHVLASGRDINVLVLDTGVYSNTGGQRSKATPLGATAKFAAAGKDTPRKDLGLLAMTYGSIYVATVAIGAKDAHTLKVYQEAESYPGPSLIIAYAHCIAHGFDMTCALDHQKLAVESGVWPLYRFDPRRAEAGEPPFKLDSGQPKRTVEEYMRSEGRFRMVETKDPERFTSLLHAAERDVARKATIYEQLANLVYPKSIAAGIS
ncbi:MAG: pyruvate:ferredoxin (flavodoxin) oxidoreductase [Polyangiaceae bacterium]|nr:pyruvate:ferredoxin (flavodoxin) oxidoreductase [Polyangiaceae bacterium]